MGRESRRMLNLWDFKIVQEHVTGALLFIVFPTGMSMFEGLQPLSKD